MTNLQFNVPASAGNTVLLIGFRDDPAFLGLDDISVLPLSPLLQNATSTGSAITIGWSALPGSLYQIQSTTNLAQTNWISLGDVDATNYTMTVSKPIITNLAQFYRIVLLP